MKNRLHIVLLLIATVALSACGKARHKPDVWDMYDVRHPVPANSQVPVSQATQYKRYIDNDEYYTVPDGSYPADPD